MKKKILLWSSLATVAIGAFGFFAGAGSTSVNARKGLELNTTPQALPFSQNWSTATLITTDDDWAGVPGIVGYRGDDIFTTIGGDLSTVVADGSGTPLDVNANRSDPDTFISGGITEFDGIANPVVALQGSGTADVPHLVIYLNTTGNTNVNFACNLRDIDNSADNSLQQVNIQYRVGGTGDYTNVPGGYFADVSAGPSATMTTPVNLALPSAVDNQPLVEIRVATINAQSNDEWIGIDDINVTGTAAPSNTQHHVDFNGDGKTDFATVRNTGGGPSGQITWYVGENSVAGTVSYKEWGLTGDFFVPEDYDGDNKTDHAVWRAGAPGVAAWYIFQSQTNTVRAELFGQTGDDPKVVGDYDGDGKADLAVYRSGANSGDQSTWFYRTTAGGPVFGRIWGQNGDFPAPGDYDGDGKRDFAIQRNNGGGQAAFWFNYGAAAPGVVSRFTVFGTPTDVIVPGDYDGDGKTDLAVARSVSGVFNWFIEPSTALGTFNTLVFGTASTDFFTHGDYDGDGKTDVAIWRPSATTGASFFAYRQSSNGAAGYKNFSQNGDYPVANYNRF